jgi:hypothetical protein
MLIRNRTFCVGIWAILLPLLAPCMAHACSVAYRTVEVGPDFRVRVTDRGRPVKGLRLVVGVDSTSTPQHPRNLYAVTDSDGYVRFSNHSPGSFIITTDKDDALADAAVVKVSPGGPRDVTVSLRWPSVDPIAVRSVTGTMRGPDFYPSEQQVPLSLSLLESVSSRVIAETNSDSKGRFKFGEDVPAGVYFLRLNLSGLRSGRSGEQMQGMIAIEVSSAAKQSALNLDLGWSSCGLSYAQQVTYPELELAAVCGDIADVMCADVPNAEVLLVANGEGGEIIEETRSGAKGGFALQKKHEGSYQLLIKYPGFRPYLRPVRINATGSPDGCPNPVKVQLQVAF